ncbi:MAG: ATP-grasp domain-containing protein [Gemmatimonadota bacterium]
MSAASPSAGSWPPVLVAGAESRPGLLVVRGLGRAGIPVIAAGSGGRPLGFASRYATVCRTVAPSVADADRFVGDVLDVARSEGAALIVPATESALVALEGRREEVDAVAPLAAAPSAAVRRSLDKREMLPLAERLGLPIPRQAQGQSLADLFERTRDFEFPVAIKPFGPGVLVRAQTGQTLDLKVTFAENRGQLEQILSGWPGLAPALIVQEYVLGLGVGIEGVYDHGRRRAMLAYDRVRENPLTGGVATIRRSIPLPEEQAHLSDRLLEHLGWHGVGMTEWKRRPDGRYVFMELNGRFSAGGTVTLDSGLNFPHFVAALFLGRPLPTAAAYRVGVTERWLIGDLQMLERYAVERLSRTPRESVATRLPSAGRVLVDFVADFRPGVHLDEVKRDDWGPLRPWLVEVLRQVLHSGVQVGKAALRPWVAPLRRFLRGKQSS